ncbi:hypothetical protein WN51_03874 [Melipona quadrifasciata]|uniref:Uncharacterized protein n=1 Tax=Melipona quadrifasciata TaxID=166423 RepID=A0A0N0BKM6_9HYME|nr:hypothetical protein WN51_03874 [Melipona quadrifasciata]
MARTGKDEGATGNITTISASLCNASDEEYRSGAEQSPVLSRTRSSYSTREQVDIGSLKSRVVGIEFLESGSRRGQVVGEFLPVLRRHVPPHHVVHVVVERRLVLAGSIAGDPSGTRAGEYPGGLDRLHGGRRSDHVPRFVPPVQGTQRDRASSPSAPGFIRRIKLANEISQGQQTDLPRSFHLRDWSLELSTGFIGKSPFYKLDFAPQPWKFLSPLVTLPIIATAEAAVEKGGSPPATSKVTRFARFRTIAEYPEFEGRGEFRSESGKEFVNVLSHAQDYYRVAPDEFKCKNISYINTNGLKLLTGSVYLIR